MKRWVQVQIGVVCLGLAILAIGCEEKATVYISRPQVFTRERLVMARQRELQFLYKQLENTDVPTGFQGGIDERTLTAFQNSLSAQLSPVPASQPSSAGTIDFSKLMAAPTTQNFATGLTLSAVDHFNDQMAFRNAVNAVIREEELDDTHDLSGHTLYTLKFDSAIMPSVKSSKPVIVLMGLKTCVPDDKRLTELYEKWLIYMTARLHRDENGLVQRFRQKQLTPEDQDTMVHIHSAVTRFNAVMGQLFHNSDKIEPYGKKIEEAVSNIDPYDAQKTADKESAELGLELCVDDKYETQNFTHLITIGYDIVAPVGGGSYAITSKVSPYLPPDCSTTALGNFKKALAGEDGFDPGNLYVDSVDPQEYAQNISDVSSESRLLNLALSISALLGKAGSASDTAQYLHQSQELLQAIRRNPLAIGFHDGKQFGWLIGSPFRIKCQQPVFEHQPGRQSYAVSIVVPVWVDRLRLCPKNAYWLDDDGNQKSGPTIEGCDQEIHLPADYEAITTAFLYQNTERGPTVSGNTWTLQSGLNDDQTLLILGPDLWRNPQVFVSSQRAQTVDILPNMRGVLAHFPKVQELHNKMNLADLTVVTTFGATTLRNAVTVLPPPSKSSTALSAKLATAFVVAGSKTQALSFTVDPGSFPAGYSGFSVGVRPFDALSDFKSIDISGVYRSADGKMISFPLTALTGPGFGTAPTILAVDLRLKLTPFDDPVNLLAQIDPSDRKVIYFPAQDQEKPRLATTQPIVYDGSKFVPDSIELKTADNTTRDNVYTAFPGIKPSIDGGTAKLVLQQAGQDATYPLALAEKGTGFVAVLPAKQKDLPVGKYDAVVEFTPVGSLPGSVSVIGGQVTINPKP